MTTPAARSDGERPAAREDSFEELYATAPCGLLSTTSDGVVVTVNDTLLRWIGVARDDVLGQQFTDLLDSGSQLFYETRYQPVLQLKGEVREVALALRRPGRDPLAVLVNSDLVTDATGSPVHVRTAVFDSTARKGYERELLLAQRAAESSEARVRVLQDASSAFGSSSTDRALSRALVSSARDAFAAAAAAVLLADDSDMLTVSAGSHPLDQSVPLGAARPETDAIRRSEVLTFPTLDDLRAAYPEFGERLATTRYEAMTVAPLINEGHPLGVLVAFFGRRRTFDDREVELHEALARQAVQVFGRLRLQNELVQLALHDQLTGLANRTLLHEQLDRVLVTAQRNLRAMALIFLDLDGFKAVNDNLGHATGDTVLRTLSTRMEAAVRRSDIVGRYGGDEFVIICEDTDEDAARRVAERIRAVVSESVEVAAGYAISASVGVALYSAVLGTAVTAERMFHLADDAMYESKRSGKDRVTVVRAT
ncbi:sensor domain-containing diguanylate cyclase [Planctomonas psychrotolerans]|uniref:sensor domain-containing diguanylate cyclase n=1 Tax=Planctomonas psychrotolerans TaxID=2528712 RepID=UPI00123AD9F8|nr:diguanylate cyclase [Planctomonas psychrotolerans]